MDVSESVEVELIQHVGNDLQIARSAWVSSGKQDLDPNPERVEKLINFLMAKRHGTPFEHNSMTFLVEAPLFVFREWHRHRIGWSYNEMSSRYLDELPTKFWNFPKDRPLIKKGKATAPEFVAGTPDQVRIVQDAMSEVYQNSEGAYNKMIEHGIANEVARAVLPVGLFSKMYATCNARSLMHFLSLRTHRMDATFPSHPQKEIEQCADKMEQEFKNLFPITSEAFERHGRVAP